MSQYHVGVDLHKTVAQVCVLDSRGEVIREWRASLPDAAAGAALGDALATPDARQGHGKRPPGSATA